MNYVVLREPVGRGYNDTRAPTALQPGQAQVLRNVNLDEVNRWTKRGGLVQRTTANVGDGGRITLLFDYQTNAGVQTIIIAEGTRTFSFVPATGAVATLGSGFTSDRLWDAVNFNGTGIFVNGANAPQTYDGTTWAALAGSPPSGVQYAAVYANHVFLSGASAAPNRIYVSDVGLATTWPVTSFLDVISYEGDIITGLGVAGDGQLTVFKRNSIWAITGTDITTFQLRQLDTDIGCTGFRTIKAVNGALYFLSEAGPYRTTGGGVQSLIDPQDRATLNTFRTGTSRAQDVNSSAIFYRKRRQYMLGVAKNSGDLDTALVLQVDTGDWTEHSWGNTLRPATLGMAEDQATDFSRPYLCGHTSRIYEMDSGGSDDGATVDFFCRTRRVGEGGRTLSFRKMYVLLDGTATFTVTPRVFRVATGVPINGTARSVVTIGGSLFGQATFGSSTFGGDALQSHRVDFDEGMAGTHLEVDIRNQSVQPNIAVAGLEFLLHPKGWRG